MFIPKAVIVVSVFFFISTLANFISDLNFKEKMLRAAREETKRSNKKLEDYRKNLRKRVYG